MPDDKQEFHWELLKLMLQVAWADDVIEPEEKWAIISKAERLQLNEAQIAELETHLRGEGPLPPPNMQILRGRKDEVIQVVEELALADDHIADEENQVLAQITELLSVTD